MKYFILMFLTIPNLCFANLICGDGDTYLVKIDEKKEQLTIVEKPKSKQNMKVTSFEKKGKNQFNIKGTTLGLKNRAYSLKTTPVDLLSETDKKRAYALRKEVGMYFLAKADWVFDEHVVVSSYCFKLDPHR